MKSVVQTIHDLSEGLSWMSPALGLALVLALVVALVYSLVAARPLHIVPLYWVVALAGFAGGQALALSGWRWWPVGDLAVGSGLAACAALFAGLHLARLWYTTGRRTRPDARSEALRRQRSQR
jgi:hypothetical protein